MLVKIARKWKKRKRLILLNDYVESLVWLLATVLPWDNFRNCGQFTGMHFLGHYVLHKDTLLNAPVHKAKKVRDPI